MLSLIFFIALVAPHHNDFDCLASAIYFEARNQSYAGKLAVASVITNRVYHDDYPSDYCGVIQEYKQFSYLNSGVPAIKDLGAWMEALNFAADVYRRDDLDITEGAIFYHADYVTPKWDFTKIEKTTKIDSHIFYKER